MSTFRPYVLLAHVGIFQLPLHDQCFVLQFPGGNDTVGPKLFLKWTLRCLKWIIWFFLNLTFKSQRNSQNICQLKFKLLLISAYDQIRLAIQRHFYFSQWQLCRWCGLGCHSHLEKPKIISAQLDLVKAKVISFLFCFVFYSKHPLHTIHLDNKTLHTLYWHFPIWIYIYIYIYV